MNKVDFIVSELKKELENEVYPAGCRFPSEYELAKRFGAARITANKAVSRLIDAGYLSRGVRGAGTSVIKTSVFPKGFISYVGVFKHLFFTEVLDGIQSSAMLRDYMLNLVAPTAAELNSCMEKLITSGCKGVITNGYSLWSKEYPLPVIYIDECTGEYDFSRNLVINRNCEGAYSIMRALLENGHREIAIYTNRNYLTSHSKFRIKGYLDAMKEFDIPDLNNRIFSELEKTSFDALGNLTKMLDRYPGLTAIACDNDNSAYVMLKAMKLKKIKRPDDILLTGFGNVPGVSDLHNLPTIDQHPYHLGARACEALIDIIEGKIKTPFVEYIDTEPVNFEYINKRS